MSGTVTAAAHSCDPPRRQFPRLGAVELEVIRRRPCVQVLDLRLARVCANARYHQICVVGEFEDSITRVYRMQVGRGNNVRGWS